MATKNEIEKLNAEIIPGTEAKVDGKLLKDGWTDKNFRPNET